MAGRDDNHGIMTLFKRVLTAGNDSCGRRQHFVTMSITKTVVDKKLKLKSLCIGQDHYTLAITWWIAGLQCTRSGNTKQ